MYISQFLRRIKLCKGIYLLFKWGRGGLISLFPICESFFSGGQMNFAFFWPRAEPGKCPGQKMSFSQKIYKKVKLDLNIFILVDINMLWYDSNFLKVFFRNCRGGEKAEKFNLPPLPSLLRSVPETMPCTIPHPYLKEKVETFPPTRL